MKKFNAIKEFDIQEMTESNLNLMKEQILEIPETPENREQYASIKEMHCKAKKLLPIIEKRRKELKSPILEEGRLIDKTAKKAVGMVQPLIELSGSRRSAWEDNIAAEKAEKKRIENERIEKIDKKIKELTWYAEVGQQYNRAVEHIESDLAILDIYEISSVDFQERTEEAEKIKADGIKATKAAIETRKKIEKELAESARIKAEQEAEAKRLKEEKAKIEAERKKQEKAAAEKRRQEEEKLRLEREALEKEKARLEAEKQAEKDKAFDRDWDDAHQINFNLIHSQAIKENAVFDDAIRIAIENLHGVALKENEVFDHAKKEKLKADAKRAKLINNDKKILSGMLNVVDDFISNLNHVDGEYKTNEAAQIELDFITQIKTAINIAKKAHEGLV